MSGQSTLISYNAEANEYIFFPTGVFSQFYHIRKNEYLTYPLILLQPYRAYARYGQAIPRPEGRQYSYASMADMDWGWKKR